LETQNSLLNTAAALQQRRHQRLSCLPFTPFPVATIAWLPRVNLSKPVPVVTFLFWHLSFGYDRVQNQLVFRSIFSCPPSPNSCLLELHVTKWRSMSLLVPCIVSLFQYDPRMLFYLFIFTCISWASIIKTNKLNMPT
jgi:hypothetical protein